MKTKKFARDFCIYYYNVNTYKEATLTALLNYLQETAISHSESVGYGIDNLKQKSMAWILNRWSVKIERYPLLNETITVETWPSGFERFYANREFIISDSQKNIIARAASLWVLIDTDRKRPKRIPEEFGNTYGTEPDRVLDNPFSDLDGVVNEETKRDFLVRRSDIDTNNHVNNISYIDWLLETVPDEVYNNYFVNSLEVIYKKETVYGSVVKSVCEAIESSERNLLFRHCIKDADSETELALCKTIWIKRNNFT